MEQQLVENRVERRRRRRRGIVALLGAVSMLTIGAGSISLAQFTDTAGATWNFTAGTIDISVNPTAFAAINPMMPGDVNTQPLTVTNGGTAQLRYAMTATATNALGTAIQLTVVTMLSQKFGWDFFTDGLRIHRAKGRTHTGIARAVGTAAAAGPVGRAIVRRFAGLILMCQPAHAPELHIVTNALQENGSLRHR